MRTYTPCLWEAMRSFDEAQSGTPMERDISMVCMWLWLFDAAINGEI